MMKPLILQVSTDIQLELINRHHAEALFSCIDANRAHLGQFLPWVEHMKSVADVMAYIQSCEQLQEEDKEISFVIIHQNKLVGRIGLHHIQTANRNGAIGYWLAKTAVGKGIMLNSCKKILDHGFGVMGLNRIEIKAATENRRSQAIPEKLNFVKEGILRQAELVNNKFLDLVLYAMLREDWTN
ncbi:GNAT family N-acetyltransferase [Pedobacter rhizosphaerae]|uniref:Ribosomal-protein-serine acetyltransferase n=1 Tax=Pedobacter rhizosphaerae TaxID=390241 RepID=A0A1H9RLL1_9SPHI|nr:GNAT family protein [Pedobacter rhizosphaerae]SER73640.1 ribosomal-protein-serine acetyltransferase [Pedobacter rhizosphaerae]